MGGTQKIAGLYWKNPIKSDDFGGTPILGNLHMRVDLKMEDIPMPNWWPATTGFSYTVKSL